MEVTNSVLHQAGRSADHPLKNLTAERIGSKKEKRVKAKATSVLSKSFRGPKNKWFGTFKKKGLVDKGKRGGGKGR